jgi:hypothetical protein
VKAERGEGDAGGLKLTEDTALAPLGAVLAIAVQVLPGQEHAGPVALGLAAVALDGAQVLLSTAIAADPVPDTQHTLIAAPEPPVGSRQVTPELGAPSAAGACVALVDAIAEAGRRQPDLGR